MKFVVAVDGSAESDRALEHAIELAVAAGASLTVVHSVDPDVYGTGPSEPIAERSDAERSLLVESVEDAEARGERVLEEARATIHDHDPAIEVTEELLYGNPVETVPEFASDHDFDGIIVGHRGLSAVQERVIGSVAKGIVERAAVPVTVVR